MITKQTTYISVAETAKLVRAALKRAFPGQKFSVRSHSYAGGASINVKWVDGPRESRVEDIVAQYKGGGFDGSIDMKHYRSHWLRPDGSTLVRYDSGTQGSGGYVPSEDNRALEPVIPDDAVAVHFGADFIFCSREISDREAKIAEAETWIRENCHCDGDRSGNYWVSDLARGMAYKREDGQSWADVTPWG